MTYNFRYNKFRSGGVISILSLIFFWFISIPISTLFLYVIGIGNIINLVGTTFLEKNTDFKIMAIFSLPILFMTIFMFFSYVLCRHIFDSKNGVLNIFSSYATLYYKGKEITLEKNNFSITFSVLYYGRKYKHGSERSIGDFLRPVTNFYVIETENQKYKIYGSIQEAYEKTTFSERFKHIRPELSLDIAMKELFKLSSNKN